MMLILLHYLKERTAIHRLVMSPSRRLYKYSYADTKAYQLLPILPRHRIVDMLLLTPLHSLLPSISMQSSDLSCDETYTMLWPWGFYLCFLCHHYLLLRIDRRKSGHYKAIAADQFRLRLRVAFEENSLCSCAHHIHPFRSLVHASPTY